MSMMFPLAIASFKGLAAPSLGRRTCPAHWTTLAASLSGGAETTTTTTPCETTSNNPLLSSWSQEPFHLPPFSSIRPHHFQPALQEGMKRHLDDLQAIVDNDNPPTFHNVIAALDRAGSLFHRVSSVFSNMCSSLNTPELQAVQLKMSPVLARHQNAAYTLEGLFPKIDALYRQQQQQQQQQQQRHNNHNNSSSSSSSLTPEQMRLVERIHMDFTRAGADMPDELKSEYADIETTLATLGTQFSQNVLQDEETYEMVLGEADMTGCPDSLKQAARAAAVERHKNDDDDDTYVITLSRSLVEPFLTFSNRRDLRQQAFEAWTRRGELHPKGGDNNIAIAQKILQLRQRQAQLHGYKSFAEYQCVDRMAKTPANVMKLLEDVWVRAKESANRERQALEDYVAEMGEELEGGIQPWDWRYYAEKVRVANYDFDESLLKPYLSLETVTQAVMGVSHGLFGLTYKHRPDIVSYHPSVETYEVRKKLPDGTDKLVAIFIHDNYARQFKSSGAWMSEYRTQTKNLPLGVDAIEGIPVISNNNNFARGKNKATTLLSFDDALTLFHEMGHGHHGMLSNATYSRLASTNVLTDFVELPSQLLENWLEQPAVLKKYARHYETGEPVPDELLEKLLVSSRFNEGFATVEYTACALLDMALHQIEDYTDFDLVEFERKELERLGMPQGIVMRQ